MKRKLGSALLLCAALTVAAPSRAAAATTQEDVDRAVNQMYQSLVRIMVVMESPRSGRLEKNLGAGSGAIISDKGYIITNHHVAGRGKRLICRMWDGEEVESRLVATDPLTDIAIVQLDLSKRKNKEPLHVAKFGDSDKLKVGEVVLAMGCPAAVSQSVTKGIVSNTQLMLPSFLGGDFREEGEQ
ncbi:MAG: trypsin-like peptidase domain-containing protein, partial [Kiritimatiellaeota bacterium]|nr:trypsin-like peptidase domain-containing protein [Kiritimatiellota bacterium]